MIKELIDKLNAEKKLNSEEWKAIIGGYSAEDALYAENIASEIRNRVYGNKVFIRGLIEISNYCKNNCLYCGIRAGNKKAVRYRLSKEEIMSCCEEGYRLGFRTIVMQGGEDVHFTDDVMCDIISEIKAKYPECAVTLSLGEKSRESYKRLFEAGADRYLLRHETADKEHYSKLHPAEMSFDERMECLRNLKETGFQTGCGFMIGSPGQTVESIAKDMIFIGEFKPHMVGIGPFIHHRDTPFGAESDGSVDLTVFLLSLIRIMLPDVLLPATTALASLKKDGRERGIMAGANVVMPNLSPLRERKKYALYENKASTDTEAAEGLKELKERMKKIGYEIEEGRGDHPGKVM